MTISNVVVLAMRSHSNVVLKLTCGHDCIVLYKKILRNFLCLKGSECSLILIGLQLTNF